MAGKIDTERDPSEDTLRDGVTNEGVVDNWISGSSLLAKDLIIGVQGDDLGVGAVWGDGIGFSDEILIEEDLSDVGNVSSSVGTVLIGGSVEVGEDVEVGGSAGVVTWEKGGELCDSLVRGWLKLSQEGGVQVAEVGRVSVTAGDNTRVDTGGVACPDLDHSVGDWVTGGHVDDLGVKDELDTLLVLAGILTDILSSDV